MVALAVTGIMAALLLPVMAQVTNEQQSQKNAENLQCWSNLKQIAIGIVQYTQDHDEKYPLIANGTPVYGWAGAIQPYLRDTELLQCPAERHDGNVNPRQAGYTDYWSNRNLAGHYVSQLDLSSWTLLLGDGDGGYLNSNARYAINSLPRSWLSTAGSPARRHLDGANYAFADGHVKWVQPQRIMTKRPGNGIATFAVR